MSNIEKIKSMSADFALKVFDKAHCIFVVKKHVPGPFFRI